MSILRWQRYDSPDFDITCALKVGENLGKTVLFARWIKHWEKDGNGWANGDFIVGEKSAWALKDLEVLMGDGANFYWEKCYGGYVPRYAVRIGRGQDGEPIFLGRADVNVEETGKPGGFRGGRIYPSLAGCRIRAASSRGASVWDTDGETGRAKKSTTYHKYEVLQITEALRTSGDVLPRFVREEMDKETVLSELEQLYQLHFHGTSQLAFHVALSILWANSGLDIDFFFPEALPWLLDLAQIHGLPSCLRQCLYRRLETIEPKDADDPLMAIKLVRLFKYSATDGFHYQFGTTQRERKELFHDVKLPDKIKGFFDRATMDQLEGISIGQQAPRSEPMQAALIDSDESETRTESGTRPDMKPKGREMGRIKPKSLFSQSNVNRRAPLPHSVMVQKCMTDSDFGIQVTIQDDQMLAELELPKGLSPSELVCNEKQAEIYLEDASRTEGVAEIVKTLLAACQGHRETGVRVAAEESADGQVEENQLIEPPVQVTSLYEILSALLDTVGERSAGVSTFLNPLLEHLIRNGWGGTLTPKEMSDLVVVEAFKTEVVPDELKVLLAESFMLSLFNHFEDSELSSTVAETVLDFILTQATTNRDSNLLRCIMWILSQSPATPEQLHRTIFPKLTGFLKTIAEKEFLRDDLTIVSILRLIHHSCRTYSMDTVEVIGKYLEGGLSQAGRIYCAQWLKRAATEADTFLDEKALTILRNSLDDPDPCIKYNVREAFATEINKQRNLWTSETFPDSVILSEIIATEPIILTLAGRKPEYFTHAINLPILQILNFYQTQHEKSKWKVIKSVEKLFGKGSRPQESLSKGWEAALKESLRYLGEQEDAIPAAVFDAVDKVFVEQDNCSVLPACVEFICKRAEHSLDSEHVTFSSLFLEQLCRRLRLSRLNSERHVYLECFYMLRKLQELPDDIFQVYHIEAGAARLLSASRNSKEWKLVRKLGIDVPPNAEKEVTESTLGWIEIYLRTGFLLSTGIIDAYESTVTSVHQTTPLIKAGLTAAAISGQVIPENILSKVLQRFPSSPVDQKEFELARACLQNQSLPNQVLIQTLRCLREAEMGVKGERTAEACLVIICSAYLLDRELPALSDTQKLFSESGIGGLVPDCEKRELGSSNETIILGLLKTFTIPGCDSEGRFNKTSNLFLLAKKKAQKDRELMLTGSTETATVLPNRTLGDEELLELYTNRLHELWGCEAFEIIFRALRKKSGVRRFLRWTLMTLEPSRVQEYGSEASSGIDMLPLARAAFISMVTSSTEDAAEDCRKILQLICTKFVERDLRLASVVTTLERLQKLGIQLFSCIERLMTTFSDESRAYQLNNSRRKLEGLVGQSPSLFSPLLDDFDFSGRVARWKEDRKDSYLRQGDLLEELLLVALRKGLVPQVISTAGLSERSSTVEILFQTCLRIECLKYNCPTSLLIEYIREHVTPGYTWPSGTSNNEKETASTHLVNVSVISSITKRIREKNSNRDGTAGFFSGSEDSTAALASELLEAFHYNLPRLNLFLSKLTAINIDNMWKILPGLYNSKLDLNNIHDDNYEIEVEAEEIMIDISSSWEPSAKKFMAAGHRYLLRQRKSFWHLIVSDDHVVANMKAVMRVSAYEMDPFNFETVQLVRSNDLLQDPRKYLIAVNEHIQKIIRNRPRVILSLVELVSNVRTVEGRIGPLTLSDLLTGIRNVVSSGDGRIIPLSENKKVSVGMLTLRRIKEWANYVRVRKTEVDLSEAICVVNKAVNLWRLWDLTTEQILAIFLGLSQSKDRNPFLELSTGSGKSVVIAVIAVVKALRENKVDIYTSNHLLARRDAQEWKEFYSFFNLSCSSNGDEALTYVDGQKECYSKNIDIVYGDIKQFQFDTLRSEFMGLGTRSGRPYDDVIIDEVDSILLDEGPKLAMLSTTFMGMDKLEPIYHLIRSTLLSLDSDQTYYSVDDDLYVYKGDGEPSDGRGLKTLFDTRREYLQQKIEAFIRALLRIDVVEEETFKIGEYFQLPPHLLQYARSQVSNWADAAITAEALEENKDYLLKDNKVVPIDPHTGVLQELSNWGNGLHQFLQIKHEVDFTPESLTTNYLSNWAMVQKYKHGIVGLTGTLGSTETFGLLLQYMSADCVALPNRVVSRFVEFPNIIVRTRQEWREAIVDVTETEISVGRAVLLICQTVKEARRLHRELDAKKCRAKLQDRSDTWMEHHLQQVQPGDVIVTTNLGTRGMDIQASAIESSGGLHVILAYMPPNTRIVRQAFGRTSRKGNLGSGHFIIKHKAGTLQPVDIRKQITDSEVRDFGRYFQKELPLVTFKDKVYADFVAQYSQTRKDVRRLALDHERSISSDVTRFVRKAFNRSGELSGSKYIILEAIQEVWASYLKLVLDHPAEDKQDLSLNELKQPLEYALNKGCHNPKELFQLTRNCYHPTRYGFEVYRKLRSLEDPLSKITKFSIKVENSLMQKSELLANTAADYFKLAVDLDPTLSPAAHVGLAYVLLKRGNNYPGVGDQSVYYKANALSFLKNAKTTLETDTNYLRFCLKQLSNPSTSRLANQLTTKIEALEAYANVVNETCRTVQLSLRPVQVTATDVCNKVVTTVWINDGNGTSAADINEIFEAGNEIELEFHGLKANKDLDGYSFQCENAVKLLHEKMGDVQSENTIGQPTVSLIVAGDDIKIISGLSRANFRETSTTKMYRPSLFQWNALPDVLPTFELKFGPTQRWDQLEKTAHALNVWYKIVLRGVEGASHNLSSLAKASRSERYKALTETKLVTETIDNSKGPSSGDSVVKTNQLTINMAHLQERTRRLLVEELLSKNITFDVLMEGVHLEDNEISLKSRKYVHSCSHVSIWLPHVSRSTHGADINGRQEQILQAVRLYCDSFRKEGITPILKIGHLDQTLSKSLYEEVNRDSDSMQQLRLVPVRDVEFEETPSAEAFRQLEQQGLLLVASFAEKNAIPKKTIVLVGTVATIELAAGLILCALEIPLGAALIKMALSDVWKIKTVTKKREFSLVKYSVGKIAQVANKGLGEVIELDWISKFVSSLKNTSSMNELETAVMNQMEKLTMTQIKQAGDMAAADLFFLYFDYGGLKTKVVKKIKDTLRDGQQLAVLRKLLKDLNARELCASFYALVTVFQKDAKDELLTWLNSLDQRQLWCTEDVDGLKSVDWEILKESVAGKDENFGLHLLKVIKDAVLHNLNVHCTRAFVNILMELKSHCFELCLNLLRSSDFPEEEVQLIGQETKSAVNSPTLEFCRILDEKAGNSLIDGNILQMARVKLQEIKDISSKLREDSDFTKDLKNTFLRYFQDALNNSEVLDHIILKSVPPTSMPGDRKLAKVVDLQRSPVPSSVNIRNAHFRDSTELGRHSTCEGDVTQRLMQIVSEGCVPEPTRELPQDLSKQLPTLIVLLHEMQVEAVLLQTEDYEEHKSGNFNGYRVVIYKLAFRKCQLQSLEVMDGEEQKLFTGPKLVLKALSYLTGGPIENLQSILDTFLETQKGKNVYNGLLELCQTAIDDRQTKAKKACALQ